MFSERRKNRNASFQGKHERRGVKKEKEENKREKKIKEWK